MLVIEKLPENTYLIDEEWGYRLYIWTDTTNSYDPKKEYHKMSSVLKKDFPGFLQEIHGLVFRSKETNEVIYSNDGYKLDESKIKSIVYILKINNELKAYCGDKIKTISVDVGF